jgi:hypothetical protein
MGSDAYPWLLSSTPQSKIINCVPACPHFMGVGDQQSRYWHLIPPRCKIMLVQTISSKSCMQELFYRIRRDGRNPGNGILKVDGFINHRVDPALMEACSRQLDARMPVSGKRTLRTRNTCACRLAPACRRCSRHERCSAGAGKTAPAAILGGGDVPRCGTLNTPKKGAGEHPKKPRAGRTPGKAGCRQAGGHDSKNKEK